VYSCRWQVANGAPKCHIAKSCENTPDLADIRGDVARQSNLSYPNSNFAGVPKLCPRGVQGCEAVKNHEGRRAAGDDWDRGRDADAGVAAAACVLERAASLDA
jgi:hypothetical protein